MCFIFVCLFLCFVSFNYIVVIGLFSTKIEETSWLPQSITVQRYYFFLIYANYSAKKCKK